MSTSQLSIVISLLHVIRFSLSATDADVLENYLKTLNEELLASKSATTTLQAWCHEHHLASPDANITATQVPDHHEALPSEAKTHLGVVSKDEVKYRRVKLKCGDRILSNADNWYVPGRLTPQMNEQLEKTTTPFGTAVRPFNPHRKTVSTTVIWHPSHEQPPQEHLPQGHTPQGHPPQEHPSPGHSSASAETLLEQAPDEVLVHKAIVVKDDHTPIAFVIERYTKALFDFVKSHQSKL